MMKKKSMNRRLKLNKRTIARLNSADMNDIRGGTIVVTFTCLCQLSLPDTICDTSVCTTSEHIKCKLRSLIDCFIPPD